MNVILIGFSHCGKTTFGKLLAKHLNKKFYDTDKLLIADTGCKTARELYKKIGGDEFRRLESEVVSTLAQYDDVIIATGGGAILNPVNRALLKQHGKLIYIANQPEILWERIIVRGIPAYLNPADPYQDFLKTYTEREPQYREIADQIIDATNKTPQQVVDELIKSMLD